MNSTNEAEKLKKRQQQLAAWKLKKQQKNDRNISNNEGTEKITNDDKQDDKKNDRLKRLEEWKKRKMDGGSSNPTKSHTPSTKISLRVPINLKRKKEIKNFILDEEPELKKPTLKLGELNGHKNGVVEDTEGEDIDLDQFIESLETKTTSNSLTNIASDSESDVPLEDDEDDDTIDQIRKLQEREKSLEVIDHSSINYPSFRKAFYRQPYEFNNLSPEDITKIRAKMDIQVRGDNVPIPITKWSHLGLSSNTMNILNYLNYSPSPIQCQALPSIMSGRDVLGVAKTGSGKTLSFVLPLLRHVMDQPPITSGEQGPIGLILTPTRELSIQIHRELKNFSTLTSCCCYGGSNIESQISEIKRGVQVIVGTPGRVIDLLSVNNGRMMKLFRTTYLVLDEADRMYDMGFEPQVTKILSQIRPDRQTVLFSATFPRKLEILAKKSLHNPIEIIVNGISKVAKEITQKIELFETTDPEALQREKFLRLTTILDGHNSTKILIFVEKQESADQLMIQLNSSDYNCNSIHGGKDQIDRKQALKEFKSQDLNILIATSVAARGLDVKGLDLVINYDAPNHIEDYIHRVGRTGRAGNMGTAITFVNINQERCITDLVKAMHDTDEIDERLIKISEKFLIKVKQGKEKYSFGFGGNGLEKLQELREKDEEMRLGETKQELQGKSSTSGGTTKQPSPTSISDTSLPDYEIIDGKAPETSGPDISKFHARITINDLPKQTRWYVTKREYISTIIDTTGVSITHKGQYYPANSKMEPGKDKLYLLVEGLTKNAVKESIELIKIRILEGLHNEVQIGKYSV